MGVHGFRRDAALLILAFAVLSPGGLAARQAERSSAPVVRNPGADTRLAWRLDSLWTIGGASDRRLTLSDRRTVRVAAHPGLGILLLDGAGPKVYRLSADGAILDSLGRRGGGPGEFRAPAYVTLDEQGNIAVFDRAKGGFVRWAPDGEVVGERRVGAFVLGPEIEFVAGGVAYRSLYKDAGELEGYELTLLASDGARRVLARAPAVLWHTANFPSCNAFQITVPPLFAPVLPWAQRAGTIVVAEEPAYSILVIRDGSVVRRIVRDIPARRVTREMALLELAAGWTVNGCQVDPEPALREMGHAEHLPAIAALRIAPSGEIWVKRGRVADEPALTDVFTPEGRYLGTLPVGTPYPDAFLSPDSFVTISTDEMDVPRLTAYRIVRG